MNASGNKWLIFIEGERYVFDSFSMVYISKVEDTPLISGGLYRRRAIPQMFRITMRTRVEHSESEKYRVLLSSAATLLKTVRVGPTVFSSCMLSSGSFKADEGEEKAEFEMTLTGVTAG